MNLSLILKPWLNVAGAFCCLLTDFAIAKSILALSSSLPEARFAFAHLIA
ncbi:MAG: hypothetical protein AAFQ80_09910 [Cyanobacteria bacterium J06621_8]